MKDSEFETVHTVPDLMSVPDVSWKLSWLNLSLGVLDHAERPSLSNSHSFDVFDALPGSLQLMPTMAMGSNGPPAATPAGGQFVVTLPSMSRLESVEIMMND